MSETPVIQWNVNPPDAPWRDMEPWESSRVLGMQHVSTDTDYDIGSVFFRVKPEFEPGFYRSGLDAVRWFTAQPDTTNWCRVTVSYTKE